MKIKHYPVEITNRGSAALWQSNRNIDDISQAIIIAKPIGEKPFAVFIKEDDEEQGLVIIEKDFCVIEALAQNGKISQVFINKVTEITDEAVVTKIVHEFKNGQWNISPPVFLHKAIDIAMYNAQSPLEAKEYYEINSKMSFYRQCS
ncbi:MAG: hypothetical protein ACK5N8_00355 [Alphaproteobacteria bacterium]